MTAVTRMLASLACIGACASLPANATANTFFPCYTESEIGAAQVHEMRIAMLVDALKCRDIAPATYDSYNRLMAGRGGEFQRSAAQVERQLTDRYGARQGRVAFADYETMLGNHHSGNSISFETCRSLDGFIQMVERAANTDLRAMADIIPASAVRACPAGAFTGPAPDREVAIVAPAVVAPSHDAGEAPMRVAAAIEDEEDLTPLAERIAPVTPLARAEPAAVVTPASATAPAAASAQDRLADAIKALDSAAAALRDMQAARPAG